MCIVTRLAPIGAFGAMAFTIGKYGLGSLRSLGLLLVCVYLTCAVFVVVVLGLIARLHGFSIFRLLVYIKEELLIVLGTSSSESGAAAADAAHGGTRLRAAGGRHRAAGGLLVQPRRHLHLPDDGGALRRAGDRHAADAAAATGPARRAAADVEGRGGRHRQRLHHARGDAGGGEPHSDRRPGAADRRGPLHVGDPDADECLRQRRGDGRRRDAAGLRAAAGHLEAAEGMPLDDGAGEAAVEVEIADEHFLPGALEGLRAAGKKTAGQRVVGAVHQREGLVEVLGAQDGDNGGPKISSRAMVCEAFTFTKTEQWNKSAASYNKRPL